MSFQGISATRATTARSWNRLQQDRHGQPTQACVTYSTRSHRACSVRAPNNPGSCMGCDAVQLQ